MPELIFKGKEYVYNHHLTVPYRPLIPHKEKSIGPADLAGNLIIHGDNLHALKSLLPRYAGKVDLVFIDPPYNTGNENWSYNDNVNSPIMKEWLKSNPVNSEDMLRHDKWLCMMWPRLVLLRELLSERGSLWMTLDDNEMPHARGILNEVFGAENFVATCIWHKMDSPKNTAVHFSEDHDYLLVYARDAMTWRPNLTERTEAMVARYKNPDNDPRGPWLLSDLAARNFYAQGRYSIKTPSGRTIEGPPSGSYWRVSWERFKDLERDNRIWWGEKGENRPGIKRFLSEVREGVVPQTLWSWKDVGSTRNAKQHLSQIMATGASSDLFITPKPVNLMRRVIELGTLADSIVLDSFAGSGATAHGVLETNRKDGGDRRFVLVECESYADSLTAERVRRVVHGFAFQGTIREELLRENVSWSKFGKADELIKKVEAIRAHEGLSKGKDLANSAERRFDKLAVKFVNGDLLVEGERRISERVEGLGGEFTFCTLGEPIDPDGILSGRVLPDFENLGAWLYYTATGGTLNKKKARPKDWYLGEAQNRHLWLVYKPDLGFLKSAEAALTLSLAKKLREKYPQKGHLVFAPAKFLSNKQLLEHGVEYAPLPFALYREA